MPLPIIRTFSVLTDAVISLFPSSGFKGLGTWRDAYVATVTKEWKMSFEILLVRFLCLHLAEKQLSDFRELGEEENREMTWAWL
jgi:hypothetical protein